LTARELRSGANQEIERISCIGTKIEIHWAGHEFAAPHLLSLVSIYWASNQLAGGVSVSESSGKKIRPTRNPSGFFVLGDKTIFELRDKTKLRGPER
jgi:hypothetical protein